MPCNTRCLPTYRLHDTTGDDLGFAKAVGLGPKYKLLLRLVPCRAIASAERKERTCLAT
jgi:hypothetical protein